MRRRRRARVPFPGGSGRLSHQEDQVLCWILRALVRAGAIEVALDEDGLLPPQLLLAAGVRAPEGEDAQQRGASVRQQVSERLESLEQGEITSCGAMHNAELVAEVLGLTRTETAVLAFVTALDAEDTLRECFQQLRTRGLPEIAGHVATVLGRRRKDVERALRRDGPLRSLPLVTLARSDTYAIQGPLTLSDAASEVMLRPLGSAADVTHHFLEPAETASLTLGDYPHVAADVELLSRYLQAALAGRERGVNVLVHGPPGTGKTELARALAAELSADLETVRLEDEDHDALGGYGRLQRYALCQRILKGRRRVLLLFDEVEDAFPQLGLFARITSPSHKAWTNKLLEGNGTPTLWVSNEIDQIDKAFIRRFDLVLELSQPPRAVRRRVIARHLDGLPVSEAVVDRLSEHAELSPGHVQRAGRVLRLLQPRDTESAERDLLRVVDANLRAFTGETPRSTARRDLAYDLSLLHCDADPQALLEGLGRTRRGTACFYGPPGTGKTELARHLADQLELPLHVKRASDLLDKWVGATEKNMARMFRQAQADSAVLLLDEADSFLADRRNARQNWERSQTNEMLTQMEHFDGIFICSTNLVEHLDRAALRRFALKVKFDYLRPEQSERLLLAVLREVGELGWDAVVDMGDAFEQLRRLRNLTPGDFAAVVRKLGVLGQRPSAGELVRELRRECELKGERGGRAIGFGG